MQDTHTGGLVPIADLSQQAREAALPRERQGPTFVVGEPINVKGGRFVVHSIHRNKLVLKGKPAPRGAVGKLSERIDL